MADNFLNADRVRHGAHLYGGDVNSTFVPGVRESAEFRTLEKAYMRMAEQSILTGSSH